MTNLIGTNEGSMPDPRWLAEAQRRHAIVPTLLRGVDGALVRQPPIGADGDLLEPSDAAKQAMYTSGMPNYAVIEALDAYLAPQGEHLFFEPHCAITMLPFEHPACAADGHTYEKAEIRAHWRRTSWRPFAWRSPRTSTAVKSRRLVTNLHLQRLMHYGRLLRQEPETAAATGVRIGCGAFGGANPGRKLCAEEKDRVALALKADIDAVMEAEAKQRAAEAAAEPCAQSSSSVAPAPSHVAEKSEFIGSDTMRRLLKELRTLNREKAQYPHGGHRSGGAR